MIAFERRMGGFFVDEHVDVTGQHIVNATFDGCVVERRAAPPDRPTDLRRCQFLHCTFTGDGWPAGWGTEHACPNGLPEDRHDP